MRTSWWWRSADGSVSGQVDLTAFYVLAMRAAGLDSGNLGRPAKWLREAQNRNGGWGIQPEAPSEADSTGAVLQALAAAGPGSGKAIDAGARYLRRSQAGDGGFSLAGTGVVNAQSTAWAVQGLIASGKPVGRALGYLDSVQAPDGHYRYSSASDQTPVWVTAQAVLAVERAAFPLAAVGRAVTPAPAPKAESGEPETTKQPATGSGTVGRDHRPPGKQPVEKTPNNDTNSTDVGTDQLPVSVPTTPATPSVPEPAPSADDGTSVAPYVAAGLGALALVLAAGFLWYRRRLP